MRIKRRSQSFDEQRKRISEILVLSASEAVPRHDYPATKNLVLRIELDDLLALERREQPLGGDCVSSRVELLVDARPVERLNPVPGRGRPLSSR